MEAKAKEIIEKYGTRNPYEIAKKCGIFVIHEELGEIRAYYNTAEGHKFIHVNDTMDQYDKDHAVAHCLYHALTKEDTVTYWKRRPDFIYSQNEIEGNIFAIELSINKELFKKLDTFDDVAEAIGLSKEECAGVVAKIGAMYENATHEKFINEKNMIKEQLFRLLRIMTGKES